MKKTRVNKGEIYFYIWTDCYLNFEVHYATDFWDKLNNDDFEKGNYFHTAEEAGQMIHKLRAVLKGADVIEMPSEKDAEFESNKLLELSGHDGDERTEDAYLDGFADCLHWLESKVK